MIDNRDPIRHVRIAESLWRAAQRAVVKRGDASVSHIIRRALTQYVALEDDAERGRSARRQGAASPPNNRGANSDTNDRK